MCLNQWEGTWINSCINPELRIRLGTVFVPFLSPLITDEIVILASYLDPQSLKFLFIAMNILIVGLF